MTNTTYPMMKNIETIESDCKNTKEFYIKIAKENNLIVPKEFHMKINLYHNLFLMNSFGCLIYNFYHYVNFYPDEALTSKHFNKIKFLSIGLIGLSVFSYFQRQGIYNKAYNSLRNKYSDEEIISIIKSYYQMNKEQTNQLIINNFQQKEIHNNSNNMSNTQYGERYRNYNYSDNNIKVK